MLLHVLDPAVFPKGRISAFFLWSPVPVVLLDSRACSAGAMCEPQPCVLEGAAARAQAGPADHQLCGFQPGVYALWASESAFIMKGVKSDSFKL